MRPARRPARARRTSALVGVLALLASCLLAVAAESQPASARTSGLRVVGNQLTKDGYPFLPRGFNMIGLLAPAWCTTGQGPAASAHFGQDELDAARDWNANTLRFQVSQRGLADPTVSAVDRDAYLQRVVSGVQLARSNGFVVVVSMQDQSNGCGPAHPLPSQLTSDAWSVLAPALAGDPYVMFELFNEPAVTNTADGWAQWRDGGTGTSTNLGDTPVGHEALVRQLRDLGATNVLVADGANKGGRLAGMPLLEDPAGQLMYAVHPYYLNNGQSWWDQQWGYLTSTVPVIATEWNFQAPACTPANITLTQALFPYLQAHGIGLLAHAFDVPGNTVSDWTWAPTDCATAQGGSGRMTKDYFATQTDGPPPLGACCPGLSVLATAPDRVELRWDPTTGLVDRYEVLRDGEVLTTTSTPGHTDASVEPGTRYTYAVRALDEDGNTGTPSSDVTVTTPDELDTTAPSAPTDLAAMAHGWNRVDLTWAAASDDTGVVAYDVRRDGEVVDRVSSPGFSDTGRAESTTYRYTVAAVDAAGNVGPETDPAAATTPQAPDTQPPTTPAQLMATAPTANQVTLTWRASTDNRGVARYRVLRNGSELTTTTRNSYVDATLQPGLTYDYVVTAVDAAGNTSPASNTARVLNPLPPDKTAPTVPKQLVATLQAPTRAGLTWLASTDNVGVTGYQVLRDGAAIATTTALSYVDPTLPKSSTHTYAVRALDKAGNVSAASTGASVIAPNTAASGLTGKYYDNTTFTALKLTRTDAVVDFAWPLAPATGMGADTFSVRWTGRVIPRATETYTFYTQSDDGVRLWVNGQQLVNDWVTHGSREAKGTITLKASQSYTIQVDYREDTGTALARLSWSSPTVPKAVVPGSQLLAN